MWRTVNCEASLRALSAAGWLDVDMRFTISIASQEMVVGRLVECSFCKIVLCVGCADNGRLEWCSVCNTAACIDCADFIQLGPTRQCTDDAIYRNYG